MYDEVSKGRRYLPIPGIPANTECDHFLDVRDSLLVPEYQYNFVGETLGSSHLLVLPPRAERTDDGPDHMLWVSGHVDKTGKRTELTFRGDANDSGFLGKFSIELQAENPNQAQSIAYAALAPLLSGLSAYADVPLHIESIETTDLITGNTELRVVAPFLPTNFNLGKMPYMSEEFCHYSSLYREALHTNSSFYRFLCLFKILEGSFKRRARLATEARLKGQEPTRPAIIERVPGENAEQQRLLEVIYPWRGELDGMSVHQIFPSEAHGRSLQRVRTEILEPIRNSIAHSLWDQGETKISIDNMDDLWKVNKWLPLLRCLARLVMINDFPEAFPVYSNGTN